MTLAGTFAGATIDGAKLAQIIRSPDGGTIRYLLTLADEVVDEAKLLVGYDDRPGRDSSRPHLRDTIVKRVVDAGTRAAVQVGSESPIALLHHEGTNPHMIVPVRARMLAWEDDTGAMVFAHEVMHPGTEPNPYLTDALDIVSRRHGGG